jgi:hypothetical protein
MKTIVGIFFCILLSGCGYFPWHPFGTPVTRVATAEKKLAESKEVAGDGVVEEITKTSLALDAAAAGNVHGIAVAQQHVATAKTLAVQIFGAPQVIDESKWRDLIARQTSLDDKVRSIADADNAKRVSQIAKLSADLDDREAKLKGVNEKLAQYAAEKAEIADRFLKLCWAGGILVGLYFLGQGLQFIASFNPAFQSAANLVNTFVSPVLHSSFHRARQELANRITPTAT